MDEKRKRQIIARADRRIMEIGWQTGKLENETLLLENIQKAVELGWDEIVEEMLHQYRLLYNKVQ
jgi:hypothetical protein